MKILQVVHGFLPYSPAGTETYSFQLASELAGRHEVHVFFRINDRGKKEYSLTRGDCGNFRTYAVNHTFRQCRSFAGTYEDSFVDAVFAGLLDEIKPDVIHMHHLLFLSFGLVGEAKKRGLPLVYTLHDYWLFCHRGQLVKDRLVVCAGGSVAECRECLKYLLSIGRQSLFWYGLFRKIAPAFLLALLKKIHLVFARSRPGEELKKRQEGLKQLSAKIDLFIAPSRFIRDTFISRGFPAGKIFYSVNGLSRRGLTPGGRKTGPLAFGFLGTLLPMKGADFLIEAFKRLPDKEITLLLYGRLKAFAGYESYPGRLQKMARGDPRIRLMGGYEHQEISRVLSGIDMLIVPSLWPENAPLVIQEAFLCGVPVIASRIGGIPELIEDGVNGLLFEPGDAGDFLRKIERVIRDPDILEEFRRHAPDVKRMEDHAREIEGIYAELVSRQARGGHV